MSDDGWLEQRGRGHVVASAVRPAEGQVRVDTAAPDALAGISIFSAKSIIRASELMVYQLR